MSWTCQRQSQGVKCGYVNPNKKRRCMSCLKPRPPRKRPAHLAALETDYEAYVEANGGEFCAICGRKPGGRRLDRDHCHKTGKPRALLCARCNRSLPGWISPEWLRLAANYLERFEGDAA